MANIVYKLSAKEDKITGKREIHVRFYHGRFDVRAKTNLYVQPEYWDAAKQTVKIPNTRSNTPEKQQLIMKLSALKADLESLSNDIREAYIADGGRKRDLPTAWLSDFIANRILAQERQKRLKKRTTHRKNSLTRSNILCPSRKYPFPGSGTTMSSSAPLNASPSIALRK
jgi:hypothetical protein